MYKVNPSDAMTELYGLNKADAQIFDNRLAQQTIAKKQQQDELARREKEAKLSGLMSDVSKIGKGEIRPADLDYFAGEQKSLYDDVKKAFSESRGGTLPIEKQVDFENRIADIQRKAAISGSRHKQNMSEYQKAVMHPNKYTRADEIERIQADSFDKANAGKFNEPLTTLTENFDYGQYVNDKLAPWAMEQAKRRDNRGVYANTPEERNQMIIDDLADPVKMQQAEYDFSSASDKLGTNNPIDYYVKKYADKLKVDVKPKLSEWESGGGGSSEKEPKVSGVYSPNDDNTGNFQFEYTNTTDNPYILIQDPKNPGSQLGVKPLSVYIDKKTPGNTKMKAAVQLTAEQKKDNDEAVKNSESKPYREVIELGYTDVDNIMKNKFKVPNVFSIAHGNTPKGVDVKYNNSPNSKKGTTVGPSMTDAERAKAKYSAVQTFDEYKNAYMSAKNKSKLTQEDIDYLNKKWAEKTKK
ncbi:MAG: hypothetical protein V4549_07425 [Bacteroidota bacterium]